MNSRRSFFQKLAQAAAIIALAPQLAFRAKLEEFTTKQIPYWLETVRWASCTDEGYRRFREKALNGTDVNLRETMENWRDADWNDADRPIALSIWNDSEDRIHYAIRSEA